MDHNVVIAEYSVKAILNQLVKPGFKLKDIEHDLYELIAAERRERQLWKLNRRHYGVRATESWRRCAKINRLITEMFEKISQKHGDDMRAQIEKMKSALLTALDATGFTEFTMKQWFAIVVVGLVVLTIIDTWI